MRESAACGGFVGTGLRGEIIECAWRRFHCVQLFELKKGIAIGRETHGSPKAVSCQINYEWIS